MTNKSTYHFLVFSFFAVMLSSCATTKLATQNADDVYFSDVEANKITYAVSEEKNYVEGDTYLDQNGYDRYDDYYYDGYNNDVSRFNRLNWNNNFTWRDYYFQNNLFYDPFWGPTSMGFNNFYGNGWGWGGRFNNFYGNSWGGYYGYNSPFYSYNMPWYNTSYWNFYGSFYGNSPYWGIYSYYQPGYYGNYGFGYGNPYYGNVYYGGSARKLTPRPNGSYDNMRPRNSSGNIQMPPARSPRPSSTSNNGRPTVDGRSSNGTYNPYNRPSRSSSGSSSSSGARTESQPSSSGSRPTRPSSSEGNNGRSTQPSSQPTSRPTRNEAPAPRPSSTESSSSRSSSPSSSSSGSSSSGGSSSRPTRGGN